MFSHMTEAQLWIFAITTAVVWFILGMTVSNNLHARQQTKAVRSLIARQNAVKEARKLLDAALDPNTKRN